MNIQFYRNEIKRYRRNLNYRNTFTDIKKMDEVEKRKFDSTNWYFRFSIRDCEDNIERLQRINKMLEV